MKLFIEEIYLTLKRKGELKDNEAKESEKKIIFRKNCIDENTAKSYANDYWKCIRGKEYIFWNPIIFRNKIFYEQINRPIKKSKTDLRILERESKESVSENRQYGTIPNLFSFIKIKRNDSDEKLQNLAFLKYFMVSYIESKGATRYKHLLQFLSQYYDLDPDEVRWEIDDLILIGFIECEGQYLFSNYDDIDEIDPELQTTKYWEIYKNVFLKQHPFVGLTPTVTIPSIVPMNIFRNYFPFTARNSNDSEIEKTNSKTMTFISEIITTNLMACYFQFLFNMELENEENKSEENQDKNYFGSFSKNGFHLHSLPIMSELDLLLDNFHSNFEKEEIEIVGNVKQEIGTFIKNLESEISRNVINKNKYLKREGEKKNNLLNELLKD